MTAGVQLPEDQLVQLPALDRPDHQRSSGTTTAESVQEQPGPEQDRYVPKDPPERHLQHGHPQHRAGQVTDRPQRVRAAGHNRRQGLREKAAGHSLKRGPVPAVHSRHTRQAAHPVADQAVEAAVLPDHPAAAAVVRVEDRPVAGNSGNPKSYF